MATCLPLAVGIAAAAPPASTGFDLAQRKASHWAWQAISTPEIPQPDVAPPPATNIDAFLLAKLQDAGLERARPADRRSLIRRATFDLIGLPPSPQEVDAFLADSSPDAFARVVDRLLASPHFGERWARHWLDVVRYAETLGHEFDYPLVDAWRYRDYVIRALNDDLPYDQFVREHIAGDLLDPPRRHPTEGFNESIIATAFWYMGEATHAPVDTRADQLTRIDNQVDVLSKAFLGLTVACARCHDHKFDAISSKDYYALAGYAASSHQQTALLDPGEKIEAGVQRLIELQRQGRTAARSLADPSGSAAGESFARALLAAQAARAVGNERTRDDVAREFGVDCKLLDRFIAALDSAGADPANPMHVWNALTRAEDAETPFADRRRQLVQSMEEQQAKADAARRGQTVFEDFSADFSRWFPTGWAFGATPTACGDWAPRAAGAEFLAAGWAHSGRLGNKLQGVLRSAKFTIDKPFIHYRLAGRGAKVRVIVDGYTMDNFSNLLVEGLSFDVNTDGASEWYVQSVARHIGHRAHIELVDHGDGFVAIDEIRFADSETAEPESDAVGGLVLSQPDIDSVSDLADAYGRVWEKSLVDWRGGAPTPGVELVRWAATQGLLPLEAEARAELAAVASQAVDCDAALPAPAAVVAIADGSGDDLQVHLGGSYQRLGDQAPRQLLQAIAGANQCPPAHGSGRRELAERILSPDDPFPARVMANRVWAHLFGRGIVATVDNFGALGERPTHPELLDYLATRLRDGGWSVKRLIREIMLTDAYQMASVGDSASEEQDPKNLMLHRQNVRRLEGESLRDALLAISGRLDPTPYGPPVPIHLTPFMEGRGKPQNPGPLDGNGRRSIYIEVRRNFLSPMMLAYDTPLPASCFGQRNNSNVPAQALILMNDPFVLEQCRQWADRMLAEAGPAPADRIERLYLDAFGRSPASEELAAASEFLRDEADSYGAELADQRIWSDLCHVLVNVPEFIFLK